MYQAVPNTNTDVIHLSSPSSVSVPDIPLTESTIPPLPHYVCCTTEANPQLNTDTPIMISSSTPSSARFNTMASPHPSTTQPGSPRSPTYGYNFPTPTSLSTSPCSPSVAVTPTDRGTRTRRYARPPRASALLPLLRPPLAHLVLELHTCSLIALLLTGIPVLVLVKVLPLKYPPIRPLSLKPYTFALQWTSYIMI